MSKSTLVALSTVVFCLVAWALLRDDARGPIEQTAPSDLIGSTAPSDVKVASGLAAAPISELEPDRSTQPAAQSAPIAQVGTRPVVQEGALDIPREPAVGFKSVAEKRELLSMLRRSLSDAKTTPEQRAHVQQLISQIENN